MPFFLEISLLVLPLLDVESDFDRPSPLKHRELRIEIFHEEVHGDVVAVVGSADHLPHFLDFPCFVGIVEFQVVPRNPCFANQGELVKPRIAGELRQKDGFFGREIKGLLAISDQRPDISDHIFLPFLEILLQFSACYNDAIVSRKEHSGPTLWGKEYLRFIELCGGFNGSALVASNSSSASAQLSSD